MSIIGSKTVSVENRKYFYKVTRNGENDLIVTKVELTNDQGETIILNDSETLSAETQHSFQGFETDYVYVNVDTSKELVDEALGVTQYKVRNDDITYFVNDNGDLIARINT